MQRPISKSSTQIFAEQAPAITTPAWLNSPRAAVRTLFVEEPVEAATKPAAAPEAPAAPVVDTVAQERDRLQRQIAEARARAEQEGRAAGEQAIMQEWKERLHRLDALIGALAGVREQLFGEMEGEMIRLSLYIATALVKRELSADPRLLAATVADAIDLLPDRAELKIRVSPRELELIGDEIAQRADAERIRVVPDPRVDIGCVVETDGASVDATLQARIHNISEAILAGQCEGRA